MEDQRIAIDVDPRQREEEAIHATEWLCSYASLLASKRAFGFIKKPLSKTDLHHADKISLSDFGVTGSYPVHVLRGMWSMFPYYLNNALTIFSIGLTVYHIDEDEEAHTHSLAEIFFYASIFGDTLIRLKELRAYKNAVKRFHKEIKPTGAPSYFEYYEKKNKETLSTCRNLLRKCKGGHEKSSLLLSQTTFFALFFAVIGSIGMFISCFYDEKFCLSEQVKVLLVSGSALFSTYAANAFAANTNEKIHIIDLARNLAKVDEESAQRGFTVDGLSDRVKQILAP